MTERKHTPSNDQFETTYYNADEVRRAASQQTRKKKKKKQRRTFKGVVIYLVCVTVVSALLAGIGWLLANDMCALNKEYVEGITITVEENDSVADVADKLKDAGLIEYKAFFKFMGIFMGADEKIDPGTYEDLHTRMDYRSLISSLHDYATERLEELGLIRITIPEGMTVREIIDLLAEKGVATVEELEDACANFDYQDYDFLDDDMKGDIRRMEGFLFPTTYDFDPDKSAVYAIDTMLTFFVNQLDATTMTAIGNTEYSLTEIVTIASLIEAEAGPQDDKRDVSSAIHNRLDDGWKLELDATVNYIKGTDTFDLTFEDLEIDSPYNTYVYAGLPVGPIGNPGIDAIKAAISPNDTDYYFWYTDVATGKTHFFTNLSDRDAFAAAHPY